MRIIIGAPPLNIFGNLNLNQDEPVGPGGGPVSPGGGPVSPGGGLDASFDPNKFTFGNLNLNQDEPVGPGGGPVGPGGGPVGPGGGPGGGGSLNRPIPVGPGGGPVGPGGGGGNSGYIGIAIASRGALGEGSLFTPRGGGANERVLSTISKAGILGFHSIGCIVGISLNSSSLYSSPATIS